MARKQKKKGTKFSPKKPKKQKSVCKVVGKVDVAQLNQRTAAPEPEEVGILPEEIHLEKLNKEPPETEVFREKCPKCGKREKHFVSSEALGSSEGFYICEVEL